MIMSEKLPPPGCMWAQHPKHIILSIQLTDVTNPTIKVEPTKLYFKGVGGTEKKEYEVEMEFFKKINVEKSKQAVKPREVSFILEKEEEGPYWDRLLAAKVKQPWLRIDFKNWKDDEDEGQGQDLEEMMRQMGGVSGGAGAAAAGAPGAAAGIGQKGYQRPSLDDLDIEDEEDDMPDLE